MGRPPGIFFGSVSRESVRWIRSKRGHCYHIMGHVEEKKGSGRRGSCTLCVLGIAVTLQREALESRGSNLGF